MVNGHCRYWAAIFCVEWYQTVTRLLMYWSIRFYAIIRRFALLLFYFVFILAILLLLLIIVLWLFWIDVFKNATHLDSCIGALSLLALCCPMGATKSPVWIVFCKMAYFLVIIFSSLMQLSRPENGGFRLRVITGNYVRQKRTLYFFRTFSAVRPAWIRFRQIVFLFDVFKICPAWVFQSLRKRK